jgi:site-specific DNA recombinase
MAVAMAQKSVCIYVRVSDQRQVKGTSIEMQEVECRAWCKSNGYSVERVFVELGVSAKTTNRRVLQEMLSHIVSAPKWSITAVVVWKFDRFTRSYEDGVLLRLQLGDLGVQVLSATEKTDPTPEGKFIQRIHDAKSELDNSRRSQRALSGMKYRVSQGRYVWRAPTGYLNGHKGDPSLVIDPLRGPLVKQLFEIVASGTSRTEALRHVAQLGLRSIAGAEVAVETRDHILRNPIYMGEIHVKKWGVIVRGDFEPIVSESLFQMTQDVMDGKRNAYVSRKSDREEFPLRGLILCEHCMKPVTAANSKGKRDHFPYYRCHRASGHLNVRGEKVEADFFALLESLVPDPAHEAAIEAVFREVWLSKQSGASNDAMHLRQQIGRLQQRKARALEQKVDGELTAEEYNTVRSKADTDLIDLQSRLRRVEDRTFDVDTAATYLKHTLLNTAYSWQVADMKGKKQIQKSIFPKGLVYTLEGFTNTVTSSFYGLLGEENRSTGDLVGPEGFEPPTKGL